MFLCILNNPIGVEEMVIIIFYKGIKCVQFIFPEIKQWSCNVFVQENFTWLFLSRLIVLYLCFSLNPREELTILSQKMLFTWNKNKICTSYFFKWIRERPFNLKGGDYGSQCCWKIYSDFGGGKKNNLIQSFCYIT